jgi:hypothetical protein
VKSIKKKEEMEAKRLAKENTVEYDAIKVYK